MPTQTNPLYAFNRGEVSPEALGRVDVERLRLSAEEQVNWQPTVLGPMMLRPGSQYLGEQRNNLVARYIPFIYTVNDKALIELTDSAMRVWVDDALVTRTAVATTIPDGDFSGATAWLLTTSGAGATSTIASGVLSMSSPTQGGYARARNDVVISAFDVGKEHAVNITILNGPVSLSLGSSPTEGEYLYRASLEEGFHSIAFTPTTTVTYLEFETTAAQTCVVDSVTMASAGAMEIPTTWEDTDLPLVRYDQSGDVIFCACAGQRQRRIERRGRTSWSYVYYYADEGPFGLANTSSVSLTPSALSGNITLTASSRLFSADQVGALFRLFSSGQVVEQSFAAADVYSTPIRVSGVGATRNFTYKLTGTFTATVKLQKSITSESTGFTDVSSFTGPVDSSLSDGLDNQIVWYRWAILPAGYTSGTVATTLNYATGGASGTCRVTSFVSTTQVQAEVLNAFSSLTPTQNWNEGEWSDSEQWPSAVCFYDGRLFWGGGDKIWASVSDDFHNFNIDTEGDAGPINRSAAGGTADGINWLMPLSRLIAGRSGAEVYISSSSFNEPLTPTNFSAKTASRQGSHTIAPVMADTRGIFVQQANRRLYELGYSIQAQDYVLRDLTRLNQNIGRPGFTRTAFARQPDSQIFLTRTDGTLAVLLYDTNDEVEAWWRIETDGLIEDVVVLPGSLEDAVYLSVKRVINGVTKRFLERMFMRDDCTGLPKAKHLDCAVEVTGLEGLLTSVPHLVGKTVAMWGWDDDDTTGTDLGTTVVGALGEVTLQQVKQNVVIGLPYTARFKSAKLAYAAANGSALGRKKKINQASLILLNTHHQGLKYGGTYDRMDNMPLVHEGKLQPTGTIYAQEDMAYITIPNITDSDARLCLTAASPRPATVLALALELTTHG